VSGQLHVPAALPPGKERPVPIGYEIGWTPEPVWTTWRRPYRDSYSDPSAVQPVASRYTDCAVPALPRQIGWNAVDWIHLAQDRDRWRTLVNTIKELRAPYNFGKFLSSCATGVFSRRTLFHGVGYTRQWFLFKFLITQHWYCIPISNFHERYRNHFAHCQSESYNLQGHAKTVVLPHWERSTELKVLLQFLLSCSISSICNKITEIFWPCLFSSVLM
jgi:hypothetical protein